MTTIVFPPDDTWVQKVLATHNEHRHGGLSPMELCPLLTAQAQTTAEFLASMDRLQHDHVPENGYQNVAQGFLPWIRNPGRPVQLWMEDPPHAHPILTCRQGGFGYAIAGNRVYVVGNYQ